jgi:hypothetical protein
MTPGTEVCPSCSAPVPAETRLTSIPGRRPRDVALEGFYCPCGYIWSNADQRCVNDYRYRNG